MVQLNQTQFDGWFQTRQGYKYSSMLEQLTTHPQFFFALTHPRARYICSIVKRGLAQLRSGFNWRSVKGYTENSASNKHFIQFQQLLASILGHRLLTVRSCLMDLNCSQTCRYDDLAFHLSFTICSDLLNTSTGLTRDASGACKVNRTYEYSNLQHGPVIRRPQGYSLLTDFGSRGSYEDCLW